VVDQRKQAVSIRLGESDIRNIKRIAKRLGVRDSDIIRFALKSTLSRIAPLCDPAIRGRNLVPVLVESGDELIRYFELDAFRLESIINEQVEEGRQVDRDDIAGLGTAPRREIGYPSTAEADEATAPKIAAHSPSDNSKTTISDAPIFSGRAAARADRSDRDGPQVVLLLRRRAWRSATSGSRRRFRKTGFAGVRPTAGR